MDAGVVFGGDDDAVGWEADIEKAKYSGACDFIG